MFLMSTDAFAASRSPEAPSPLQSSYQRRNAEQSIQTAPHSTLSNPHYRQQIQRALTWLWRSTDTLAAISSSITFAEFLIATECRAVSPNCPSTAHSATLHAAAAASTHIVSHTHRHICAQQNLRRLCKVLDSGAVQSTATIILQRARILNDPTLQCSLQATGAASTHVGLGVHALMLSRPAGAPSSLQILFQRPSAEQSICPSAAHSAP